jgi:beta-N-acetylhexosaminidase
MLALALPSLVLWLGACASPEPPVAVPSLPEVADWAIDRLVPSLPLRTLAGQVLMVGIENDETGRPLRSLDSDTRELLADVQPGAVVLFGRTFAGVEQVVRLVRSIHGPVRVPPIVATDYEGGLVSRLTTTGGVPATRIPAAETVGRAVAASALPGAGAELARELGRVMGRELRALGVTMNFAPVVDVNPRGELGIIGRDGRSFGDDPNRVGRVAGAIAAGMQEVGVAAVAKHFPGQGAADEDSHEELAVLAATQEELRDRDLAAFRTALLTLGAQPAGIMTGHLAAPALTGDRTPASLSPAVTRIARDELGFRGIIVTDALNMRALTQLAPEPELVVRAIEAGADMVLKPLRPREARDAVLEAVAAGRISRVHLADSVRRILRVKQRLGLLGPRWAPRPDRDRADRSIPSPIPSYEYAHAVLGSEEHRAIVDTILRLAGGEE